MGMTDTEEILHDRLNKIISKLKSSKQSNVVLIGDIMPDCYIHGFANNLIHEHRFLYYLKPVEKKMLGLQHTLQEV